MVIIILSRLYYYKNRPEYIHLNDRQQIGNFTFRRKKLSVTFELIIFCECVKDMGYQHRNEN